MKTQTSLSLRWGRWLLIALLGGVGCGSSPPGRNDGENLDYEVLPRGVKLWRKDQAESPFFQRFEDLARYALGLPPPFGKSVAFLVGVSRYQHLPQLPFVLNDLRDLQRYLIEEGGFDQVYVVEGESVSVDLIEDYMMNRFRTELNPGDRLLFYFAGHGADAQGQTGYLQLAAAREGDFARHVLAVERVREWSRVNRAAHMLFVLDACSSGLGVGSRSASPEEGASRLIQTLSGTGSRAVLTAGTAEEKTFEVPGTVSGGNGVFTRAFLDALHPSTLQTKVPAFLTIEQVTADVKIRVAQFAASRKVSLHPDLQSLYDPRDFRGTFVFLNPTVRQRPVDEDHLRLLKATPRPKGVAGGSINPAAPDLPSRSELVSKVLQEFSERDSDLLLGEHARNHPAARRVEELPAGEEILGFLYIKSSGNFLVFGAEGIYSHHSRYGKAIIPFSEFDRLRITVRKLHVVDFGTYGRFSTVGSDVATDTLVSILRSLQQNLNSQLATSTGGHP